MQRPDSNSRIVVFDGNCHVCSGWVRFLERHRSSHFQHIPMQCPEGKALLHWRLSLAARIVPQSWRDSLYRLLARNRYRWFGRRSTCYLPQ
jgi:predicted DCC family thiol-disulfide oxidoreductase YuxK